MTAAAQPANLTPPPPSLPELETAREVVALQQSYMSRDAEAVRQQRWLFRLLGSINVLILLVGALSGIALALTLAKGTGWGSAPGWPEAIDKTINSLGVVIAACGIGATVLGQLARDGDRLGRWRTLRSEAELFRAQKFATLARLAAAAGRGPARDAVRIVLEQLLQDQQRYYERRAREHRASAGVTSVWAGIGLSLSALAGATAAAVVMNFQIEWLLVLGVIAAAVSAYATDRENLRRDRSNAELYERTAGRLAVLGSGVDRVLAEVDSGNPQAAVAFTDLVVEELQAEHRRWVEVLSVTQQQLEKLDERLKEARSRSERERPAQEPATSEVVVDTDAAALKAPAAAPNPAAVAAAPTALDTAATHALPLSGEAVAGDLARWRSILLAAANVLPVAEAERARRLSGELTKILGQLDSSAPASSAIASAAALADALRADNPLGKWLVQTLPAMASIVGTAVPPAALILGIAAVGARLGEDAYRRWVASVLQTPFSPGLIEPQTLTSTTVLAAIQASPEFLAAWRAECEAGNNEALVDVGRLAVEDPAALWAQASGRFPDQAAFDRGLRTVRATLLNATVEADTGQIARAELPNGTAPASILESVGKLQGTTEGRAVLFTAVQLIHELRNQGVVDPVAALRTVLSEGAPA